MIKKFLLTAIFCIAGSAVSFACTNLLITRKASADSSNMVSYSADSHTRYGCLVFYPAARYGRNAMLPIYEWGKNRYLGEIPQARSTYSVIGNMNEHQLIIGESTWGGLEDHVDPEGKVDYGSLIYIALQRCRTAREAIKLMVGLANEYGYASTGESFSLADKDEVWFLEMISKAPAYDEDSVNVNKGVVWVARRIPDGCISAHANAARITTFPTDDSLNCMYAPDIFDYVRKQGLYEGPDENFSFADTFGPLDFSGMRGCEARVWSFFNRFGDEDMSVYLDFAKGDNPSNRMPLFVKAKKRLTVKDVADMMRDRYEGTYFDMTKDLGAGGHELPYRWRPMSFEVDGNEYVNERAIATQQTGFWFVGQSRKHMPDEIGGIIWFGVDDAGTSPLTPIYTSSYEIPWNYSEENGSMVEYSPTSMFWAVNRIAQFAYLRYNHIGAEVRAVIDENENAMFVKVRSIDSQAMSIYENSSTRRARKYLTRMSLLNAEYLFYKWKELDEYLLVKYIDGNTKKQDKDGNFITNPYSDKIPVTPDFPGYTERFKRGIVESAGERLRVRK